MANRFNSDISDTHKTLKKNVMSLKRTCGSTASVYLEAENRFTNIDSYRISNILNRHVNRFTNVSKKLTEAARELKSIKEKLIAKSKLLNKKETPKTPALDSAGSSTLTTASTMSKKKKPPVLKEVVGGSASIVKDIDKTPNSPPPGFASTVDDPFEEIVDLGKGSISPPSGLGFRGPFNLSRSYEAPPRKSPDREISKSLLAYRAAMNNGGGGRDRYGNLESFL
jgi:hypothetical protein